MSAETTKKIGQAKVQRTRLGRYGWDVCFTTADGATTTLPLALRSANLAESIARSINDNVALDQDLYDIDYIGLQ